MPAFLCGLVLGFSLMPVLLRFAKRWITGGLVTELRGQIGKLSAARRELTEMNDDLQGRIRSVDRERALLDDKTKIQDGQIDTLRKTIVELSAECERRAASLMETHNKFKKEQKARQALQKQARTYAKQLDEVENSDGKIWDKKASGPSKPFVPLSMRRAAIVSMVNLKGGVGKTTITANLGAAFASRGLRVLMIDLDHQASLSNLCLTEEQSREVRQSHRYIDEFFENGNDFSSLQKCVTPLRLPGVKGHLAMAPVHEDFIDIETKLQARWLVGQLDEDVRFRLRGALHSHQLRNLYDVVLIDCPPRWSTASANALAASDYVLIPVLLEPTSAEAVPRLLGWLNKFRADSCPELNVLGVVGNKASNRTPLISREQRVWSALGEKCRAAWHGPIHLFDEIIREHPEPKGVFAALDHRYEAHYNNLIHQIRQVIPHAHLEPSAVPPLAGSAVGGGGH